MARGLAAVRDLGLHRAGADAGPGGGGARRAGRACTDRAALLLGAEGPGLPAAALAAADLPVRIPMAAGVDSLNVAAAAAVAFYALGAAQSRR